MSNSRRQCKVKVKELRQTPGTWPAKGTVNHLPMMYWGLNGKIIHLIFEVRIRVHVGSLHVVTCRIRIGSGDSPWKGK
jgi:hypothetical protein